MAKTKKKKEPVELPQELIEAVDEAAIELAADTNLTKAEARERILSKIQARADADAEDVEDAADEVEDEETEDEDEGKKDKKGKKGKKDEDEETEDEDEDENEDEDEDEDEDEKPARKKDEKPPQTHWASRPMFKSRR